ncbi:MAG: hypothetical protein [Bacteriophage sp.]|nr:MAG: hypothetical protein [Bacteriophage sp.]
MTNVPRTVTKEKPIFLIGCYQLDEPTTNNLVWDNDLTNKPFSWPTDKTKAFHYTDYLVAWNRLLHLYGEHKKRLNKVSFFLIETTKYVTEDMPIDPVERLAELHRHFSPQEFKGIK